MSFYSESFLLAGRLFLSFDQALYEIIGLSFLVSLSATIFSCLIGISIGAFLAVVRFPGRAFINALLSSATALPPVVVGLVLYLLFSRAGFFGAMNLLYTPVLMIIAQAILVLPIIISLSRRVIEPHWQNYRLFFLSICLPRHKAIMVLIRDMAPILAGIGLTGFGRAIGEVGAVMIVGGNINHLTRTMTTAIAVETSKGELALALALGIILIFLALLVNITVLVLTGRKMFSATKWP